MEQTIEYSSFMSLFESFPGTDFFFSKKDSTALRVSLQGIDFMQAYSSQFFYNSAEFFINLFILGATGFGSIFGAVPVLIGGLRPVEVNFPANYNSQVAYPLLILLHGYGSDGPNTDDYFKMKSVAAANGMIYLTPNGIVDYGKKRYWKATDACCDYLNLG